MADDIQVKVYTEVEDASLVESASNVEVNRYWDKREKDESSPVEEDQ